MQTISALQRAESFRSWKSRFTTGGHSAQCAECNNQKRGLRSSTPPKAPHLSNALSQEVETSAAVAGAIVIAIVAIVVTIAIATAIAITTATVFIVATTAAVSVYVIVTTAVVADCCLCLPLSPLLPLPL